MKKTRTLKKVKFICDECKKESGYFPELESDDYKGKKPFPYNKDWIFIHNLELQVGSNTSKIKRITKSDGHICSEKCLLKAISSVIKKCKEDKNEN